ncbi:hypothetical protein D9M68_929500 [compost metagenome]
MIPRRHGPARRIEVRPLGTCSACAGQGVIKGVFHEMACAGCDGSGVVDRVTGEALDPQELIVQLRIRLTRANETIELQRIRLERAGLAGGPSADYQGAGGNWTGD